ncbi:hypothetical protein [Pseudomonas helleri]|uniref:hypothetical protein n=1 Tax=Pseudomonas helleri TaxID=1608996 RepID=UPI003FD179EF
MNHALRYSHPEVRQVTLTIERAKALVVEFCATYPVSSTIGFKIRETQEELYGPQATRETAGTILGSFHPRGRRALFATANFDTDEKFRRSLRHEILGHFGINTFKPEEKRAILEVIIEARTAPDVMPLWQEVDELYVGISELRKAEVLFAFACEVIDPDKRADYAAALDSFQQVFRTRARPMQMRDLISVTAMVAEGLHDRSRSQQIFPETDSDQFRHSAAEAVGNSASATILAGLDQDLGEVVYIEPSLDQQLRQQDAAEAARKMQRHEHYEDEPGMEM